MNFMKFLSSGHNILNFNLDNMQKIISNTNTLFKNPDPITINHQYDNKLTNTFPISLSQQTQLNTQDKQTICSEKDRKQPIIPTVIQPKHKIIEQILMNQQQQLINQYIQLNMKLINQKQIVEDNMKNSLRQSAQQIGDINSQKKLTQEQNITKTLKKKIKKINRCGHQDKEHYAKGMCNNCYHKYGRTKKPWNCEHQKLYASGLCQNCYINKYNKIKRQKENQNEQKQGSDQKQCNNKSQSIECQNASNKL